MYSSRLLRALPIAAILTPGTLVVTTATSNKTVSHIVPQPDFRTHTYFGSTTPPVGEFDRVDDDVLRLGLASSASENVLAITPPAANSTYVIEFYAPALLCEPAAANDSIYLLAQYANWTAQSAGTSLDYFSWVPPTDGATGLGSIANYLPFDSTTFDSLDFSAVDYGGKYAGLYGWSVKLNVFVPPYSNGLGSDSFTFVLLNCSLNNASYTAHFDFRDGQQRLDLQRGNDLAGVSNFDGADPAPPLAADSSLYNKTISYLSIMDAFGRIMTGSLQVSHYGGTGASSTLVQTSGLSPLLKTADNATLARAIEGLFQNITMSLLSSSRYVVDP